MNKLFLTMTAFIYAVSLQATEWEKPVIAATQYQPIQTEKTMYLYNTETQLFATQGNEYHTHFSAGSTGLKIKLHEYIEDEGAKWDGKTYTITDSVETQAAWKNIYFEKAPHMYVDRYSQSNYMFSFDTFGNNIFGLYAADANPDYKVASYHSEGLMAYVGQDTLYVPFRDRIEDGTGVIFDFISNHKDSTFFYKWAFISENDYNDFQLKLETYNQALVLNEVIKKAEDEGISTSQEQAVYNNTLSTLDEIKTAIKTLQYAIANKVTPESPKDVTSTYFKSYDFEINFNGWTSTTGASNNTLQTNTTIGADATVENAFTGKFWENWRRTNFTGKMYTEINDIPNGVYKFSLSAFANNGTGAYVYANSSQVPVTSKTGDRYSTIILVIDNKIECGLNLADNANSWAGIDNAQLVYYGNTTSSLMYWFENGAQTLDLTLPHHFALDSELKNLADEVKTSTDYSTKFTAVMAYKNMTDSINKSIQTYATFNNLCQQGNTAVAHSNIKAANILADYIFNNEDSYSYGKITTDEMQEQIDSIKVLINNFNTSLALHTELNDNFLILEEALGTYAETASKESLEFAASLYDEVSKHVAADDLSDEEIQKEIQKINNAIAAMRVPVGYENASDENPFDMTKAINNPSFDYDTNDGWSGDLPGRAQQVQAAEFWNKNFDMYQDLTGLPNGTYELSVQGFYRAGWQTSEVYQAWLNGESTLNSYLYAITNGERSRIALESVWKESLSDPLNVGDETYVDGIYTPNNMTAAVGYFNANRYKNSLIVKVTDGSLRIGLSKTRLVSADWTMFDNFTLTYYGNNSKKTPTSINSIDINSNNNIEVKPIGYYSLNGTKICIPQRGICIIKYSNGEVKKSLIK